MAQVDSLLDLGDLTAPSNNVNTVTVSTSDNSNIADLSDPFDPFAVSVSTTSPKQQTSVDLFDPFAQSAPTNGNLDSLENNISSPKSPPTSLPLLETNETNEDAVNDGSDLLGAYLETDNTKHQDYLFGDSLLSPNTAAPGFDMSISTMTDLSPPRAYIEDDLLSPMDSITPDGDDILSPVDGGTPNKEELLSPVGGGTPNHEGLLSPVDGDIPSSDSLLSPVNGVTSDGDMEETPIVDTQTEIVTTDDSEVTRVTNTRVESVDGGLKIVRTAIITETKVGGGNQESEFDDLLDDLGSSTPPPITSEPPDEEEEEEEVAAPDSESVTSPMSPTGSAYSDKSGSRKSDILDNLPDVQMPKRYVKPEDKQAKNAPKVLIMSDSEEFKETIESPSGTLDPEFYTSTTEYEMEPSQPFGSLLSTWASNDDGGLPSDPSRSSTQSYSKTKEQNIRTNQQLENGEPIEVIKAEDKVEDDLENLPSIKNLRSAFEVKESAPLAPPERKPKKLRQDWASSPTSPRSVGDMEETRVNGVNHEGEDGIAREAQEKEEIHFEELNNIRSRFENAAKEQKPESLAPKNIGKLQSRWDKPQDPPPEVVNRVADEEDEQEIISAAESTRNLVARFQQIGIEADMETPPERKPVRKITPPRETAQLSSHLDHDESPERDPNVIRHDERNPAEVDLPPSDTTKNLLAKFKSMESGSEAPPSPSLASMKQRAAVHSKPRVIGNVRDFSQKGPADSSVSEGESRSHSDLSELTENVAQANQSGVFESQPEDRPELVRETHEFKEEELPQVGCAKSLLAQWKSMESVAKSSEHQDEMPVPKKRITKSSPGRDNKKSTIHKSEEDLSVEANSTQSVESDITDGQSRHLPDVVRESDAVDDTGAIPKQVTRNLVSKFQQLSDSDREVTPPPKD